ncbi:hypothetical protein Poli38472_012943 [Pythium oligandrum]|uniref:Guanylate-binding protein N-terminal domain-containing protein n=1 Tax=Pythium oligandrum TaxID=41045 RepID=A0A8K1FIX9_PYTOL|nr:hypothetical protein Poli38472_012943 [Pythium oligandrum]|eukprot:TMW64321.1 hypothetical protein Poli38472_012943 [Pythium oligandrum]
MIVFVDAKGSASLYRFNEHYKALEVVRTIDIGAKTSLVMPLKTVLLDDGVMHVVGAKGNVQSINVRNQQLSRKSAKCCFGVEGVTWRGPLFAILDGLVLGSVGCMQDDSGSYRGVVEAISSEDYRALRQRSRDGIVLGSSEKLSVQAFGNEVVVFDEESTKLHVLTLQASVRSDSLRIRKMNSGIDENECPGAAVGSSSFSSHWMWVFYRLFEKFPVRGALYSSERGAPEQLQLQINGRAESQDMDELSGAVAGYLDRIMDELEKLHKPLYGLNLAQNHHSLVTFVPIQICRAEYNTLSVMPNGGDRSEDIAGSSPKDLQSADIVRSIRFGLLSPLLQSWGGQCVVVTSMGKQSTGKSYFLNHLTGSSFAIAGARCTDGAWMSVRVLDCHVLLVVIDFEGLGSFERTEQEDVFLSVLNASISMLTVFRMEMRLDKEIDDLFSKFQKGSQQLIKNESQLFRGKLYMSVKDVNPNDHRGVVHEFVTKFGRLLDANRENNFLTDMYAGQLEVNCSPPLSTPGYHRSLTHVQRSIREKLCGNPKAGFSTGKSFLDCIRLVLAKISILDWTSMDDSALKLKLAEMATQLPGIVRFGAIVASPIRLPTCL